MKVSHLTLALIGILGAFTSAQAVSIYVDAAPNVYGSPNWASWLTDAQQKAANSTFVNMANSSNPAFVGTNKFTIKDEVVYSFGDLGKRLTWVYYIPGETVDSLTPQTGETPRLEVSLINTWNGDVEDFYLSYYGQTWLVPTNLSNFDADDDDAPDGVVGIAGMAWWGAYGSNTQEALDADLAAWGAADETWQFQVRYTPENGQTTLSSFLSERTAMAPVPEPVTMVALFGSLAGLGGYIRRRRA